MLVYISYKLYLHAGEEATRVQLFQFRRFSFLELRIATNNFSKKNILRRSRFKVYKGRLGDGSLVAVKKLEKKLTPDGEIQFQAEMETISMAVHRNVLKLRGFCMTPTEQLLVYSYVANGSVASHLRGKLASILHISSDYFAPFY